MYKKKHTVTPKMWREFFRFSFILHSFFFLSLTSILMKAPDYEYSFGSLLFRIVALRSWSSLFDAFNATDQQCLQWNSDIPANEMRSICCFCCCYFIPPSSLCFHLLLFFSRFPLLLLLLHQFAYFYAVWRYRCEYVAMVVRHIWDWI